MMSWTEAFRSFSRLFSRSRSADSADSESVSEDGVDQTPEAAAAAQCSGSTGGHEGVSAAPRAPTAPPAHTLLLQTSRTACSHTSSSAAEPPGGRSLRTHTQSAEDRSEAIDLNAKELLEEKRRYDLSCPPVVTYGTYRGLREARKPKKKHSIELHSPISEGDEPAHPEQTCCFTVNTMSTDLNQSSPPWTQQIEDVLLTQGVLLAQGPTVESPAHPHPEYSNWSITCIKTEPVYRIHQAEPRPPKHLVYTEQEHLDLNAALETVSANITNTHSATNTHRPHTAPTPGPEQNSGEVCVVADRTDDRQESDPELAELQSGVEEQLLRVESRLMVDGILTSALSALQEMEHSEQGVLLSCELTSKSDLMEDNRAANAELRCGVDPAGLAVSAVLEPPAGSCALGDCSRSLPSSGYESIAGSDSDIRSFVGAASEVCSANALLSENQAHIESFCEGKSVDPAPCSGCAEIRSDEDLSTVHSHNAEISLHSPASSEESLFQEKHTADVCMCTESRVNKSQDTVKEHVLSNNCRYSPGGAALSADQESLQQSQTLSVTLSDSHSFTSDSGVVSELRAPAVHSHESIEPEAPFSGEQDSSCSGEQDRNGSDEQDQCYSQAAADLNVLPSGTEPQCSADQSGSPPWVSVRAVRCSITDDQSPSPEEHLNPADTGVCVSALDTLKTFIRSAAVHQHPRLLDADLQPDGGFSIISEEDEGDVVFVNDLGALHSPSVRRAKAYPFCLSPIYEEECVREEAPGPQEPQEEQRSVEQPAAAILSLLQSVSEKLQSSMGRGSGETCRREDCTRSPQDDMLLNHHIHPEDTGAPLILQVLPKPITDPSDDHSTDREQQELDGDVGKSANTPFYQYMKSRLMPSADDDTKPIVCHSGANTGVTERNRVLGKINPRPTAALIYDGGGERRRICRDVEDTRTELTARGATLHALRGCWLLYEDWCYRGPCVLLEEGQSVRTGAGAQQDLKGSRCAGRTDTVGRVGSVRTLLKDECAPDLHLHLSSSQCLRLCSSTELTEQQGPVCLSDICVRSGCWLVYERSGFSGASAVLEAGGRVTPVLRDSSLSCIRSLRPLKLGGPRVTQPLDPELLMFARPLLEGRCRTVLEHRACLEEMEAPGSLRVTAGIWVVFSAAGFRGHQCVLEEGDYSDCTRLFSRTDLSICSLRFLNTDFLEPSVCVKICGQVLEVCVEMPDLQDIESICVKSGVWVAFSESNFSGEQCVLEKGRYTGQLQWSDRWSSPRSLRPIHREVCQTEQPQFLIRLYTELQYGGESREFISSAADCGAAHLLSLRVIRGSWLLFEDYGFSGNQYILTEGLYPDLTSCGCPATAIRSLKPIPHSFSEPCVSVFSLSGFEGLQETWRSAVENTHFISQSVRVTGGQWVAYEFPLFRGRQVLLGPGECAEWAEISGWGTLGSIRPLQQPRGYLQLRNRALGLVLTAEDLPDGSFPAKLLLRSAERSLHTQRWILRDGLLKNTKQMGCLSVIGAKACTGAPVALWEEHGHTNQRWSITEDGHIHTHLDHSLVLDLTGEGQRLVLSPAEDQRSSQTWDIHLL
ncbi:beta/gamma crystallin domain-containing protein 3 isoform X2 [Danio aesculapii]|uniref:beta/gamma crystallin domain-containing protein 3 isoform X2 n=1 Tax=Danio aesculapii TaxID=1142201 RepID=UPI0024BFE889|nr:beta/gamma crystallin domain-containing protein 3 isoform X2 [Danio aesculapii]